MPERIKKTVAAVAVVGAVAVGASAFASAASNNGTTSNGGTTSGTGPVAQQRQPQSQPQRPDETLLTGDTADKVRSAAEDEVSGGTVLRVETDSEGSPYEAHVRKSDGTEVTVKVDKAFKVTAVEQGPGHP